MLKREASGVRAEVRENRDLRINNWHREALSKGCYMTDVDGLEYRMHANSVFPEPMVLIEYKEWHVTQPQYVLSTSMLAQYALALRANVPFWFVWYRSDLKRFRLWDVTAYPVFSDTAYTRLWMQLSDIQFVELLESL